MFAKLIVSFAFVAITAPIALSAQAKPSNPPPAPAGAAPTEEVLLDRTSRRVLPAHLLAVANQVTGSFSVFRRDLLDVALPFPDLRTSSTFHDHWIGLCAAVTEGYFVHDEALQDYVQHGENVVGEFLAPPRRSRLEALRRRPGEMLRENRILADKYEGGHSLGQRLRAEAVGTFGWRRVMARTAMARVPDPPDDFVRFARWMEPSSGVTGLLNVLRLIKRSPELGQPVLDGFIPGIPHELALRLRRRSPGTAWDG